MRRDNDANLVWKATRYHFKTRHFIQLKKKNHPEKNSKSKSRTDIHNSVIHCLLKAEESEKSGGDG